MVLKTVRVMGKQTTKPVKIESVLKTIFKDLQQKTGTNDSLWQAWFKSIGEEKAAHTKIIKFSKGNATPVNRII